MTDALIQQTNNKTGLLLESTKEDLVAMIVAARDALATRLAAQGRATLVGGTVDVVLASIVAGSNIQLTSNADAVTGALRAVITPGVGFTITSLVAIDAGAVAWIVTNP